MSAGERDEATRRFRRSSTWYLHGKYRDREAAGQPANSEGDVVDEESEMEGGSDGKKLVEESGSADRDGEAEDAMELDTPENPMRPVCLCLTRARGHEHLPLVSFVASRTSVLAGPSTL